jgi:AcrR family transcriptional regulator
MPRWEHGSKERLKQAAMELFDEQGYPNTSAVQIAERARVTTRTFFRYFPDKQAVVFADAELLSAALVQGLEAADVAQPLHAVVQTCAGFDWQALAPREALRRRDALIASNPDLLERELIKQDQMADAFSSTLRQRGVDAASAELAARVGIEVFRTAYRQWLSDSGADLAETVDTMMSALAAMAG